MYIILRKYKKTISLFLSILMLFSIVNLQKTKAASDQVTLAGWNFSNGPVTTPSSGIAVNMDKRISAIGSTITCYTTELNPNIKLINANNWSSDSSYWLVALSTKGYENITLSSTQASSPTGPKNFKLQYSLDKNKWIDIPNGQVETDNVDEAYVGKLENVSLPDNINDREIVYIRWVVNSPLAANGTEFAKSGVSGIGGINFNGSVIEGATLSKKTAIPNTTKIRFSSYSSVVGTDKAVASNATVKIYYEDGTLAGTATANDKGAFEVKISNPQSKEKVYITAQEKGKDPSEKASLNYTSIVFSQIYVNGGNPGAFYNTKFVELYNNSDKEIDLSNWSIAHSIYSSMCFKNVPQVSLSGKIKPHGYFLIAGHKGENGQDLPINADLTDNDFNPNGSFGGALVLTKKATVVTSIDDPDIVDLLAYRRNKSVIFTNNLYWGSPINSAFIGDGTILRKTNIGSDPISAFGMDNSWFTKDPSNDFVVNTPEEVNNPVEVIVHNSTFTVPTGLGNSNTVTPISELRKNDSTGLPVKIGYSTTIEGVATTLNKTVGRTNFYIQDSSGGVNVVSNTSNTIIVGNKYRITGHVAFTAGLTQFIPTTIKSLGTDHVPQPSKISIGKVKEDNESKLVSIIGKVLNIAKLDSVYDLTVGDETGELTTVRIQDMPDDVKQGSTFSFTGVVSQYTRISPYDSGYYLSPRSSSDIKGQLELNHTVFTTQYTGLDANFTANAKNADEVSLYYKGKNETAYHKIKMNTADNRNYNAKIVKEDVPKEVFSYYIQANNSVEEPKLVGSAEKPNEVTVSEDNVGPAFNNIMPLPDSEIESKHPTISINMDDPNGIDSSKTKIWIDDKEYTSEATASEIAMKISLNEEEALNEGAHTVKVSATDRLGNISTTQWSFSVAKRFTGGIHYRGTTHNHTEYSADAIGSGEKALEAAQKYNYDFFAFSDHSHDIDSALINKDTVVRKGMKERTGGQQWQSTKDLAEHYTNDHFVVFPGFELTSTTWGHANVFGTDNFIDRKMASGKYQYLQNFYTWALTYDDLVAQFNHPSSTNFNSLAYNKDVDKLFTMFEIGNGPETLYKNYEDIYFNALNQGWHVAPTYGEDNHFGTWGQTNKRTVIVADNLSKESLLKSMRNKHVYMEEDPNFTLDVSANGYYMGSTVDSKTLKFDISGSDPVAETHNESNFDYLPSSYQSNDLISRVSLISNNGEVDSYVPEGMDFSWTPTHEVKTGETWYVVKVTQMDGDRIYSAPIWPSADNLTAKVNKVSSSPINDNTAKLTANITTTETVNDVTAHFYYDRIDANHFIGDAKIDSLSADAPGSTSVSWERPVPGTHNIIVTLSDENGYLGEVNKQEIKAVDVSLIGNARKVTEGEKLVVEGIVTADSFKNGVYLQDKTGGILAVNIPLGSLKIGEKIRIYGHKKVIEKEPVIEINSFIDSVDKLGSGVPIQPKLVSPKDANAEENQGLLIKVNGTVTSNYDKNSYWINNGSGVNALVFTDDYIAKQRGPVPNLKSRDTLEAVGIAGKFTGGNRVRVRDTKELKYTDNTAPIVTGVQNNHFYKNDVTIYFDEGIATLNNTKILNGKVVKDEGTYKLEVTDAAKHTTTRKFTIDKRAPKKPKVYEVTDKVSKVTGKTEGYATVKLYIAGKYKSSVKADKTGNFSFTISKQKAKTEIKVTATDKANNVSDARVVKVVDKTKPSTPKVDKVTVKSTKITGQAEAYSFVVVKSGNKVLGKDYADKHGHFSAKISKQKAGKTLYVTAKDKAGNVSAAKKVTVKK